ncbi:tuftelin-interacting protein 11-like [Macrosteles quadrilineatus]|uniref:tuftelin-interacting protein 11-like n=1 Tax=Macrosteles quadrilineatus TaxID=74068 RepID=UPI0023E327B5|nr:tuftelin-interacting protein 11-like [Macrosteles quadrilineatus]
MSDDEVEAFDITDEDLNRAFNPGARRFRGGNSKNQQIYGMWADDSGDEGPSQRAGFSKSKKPKNYSAPVNFVAGGVHQAGKKKEKEIENKTEENDDEPERRVVDSSESSEEDEPRASFSNLSMNIEGEIAGLRRQKTQFNPVLANKGVGKWEQHTKGIGAKLLLQMGYQPGKGLGKDLQGIQAPIEASLRKGRGAIGAYGPEKGQKIADLDGEKKKKEKETVISDKVSQWRKEDGSSKKQKVQYVYKSIEDVLEESKQPGRKKKREFNELSKVKVIDMTGPEQRVLSGYHAISSVQRPSEQWEIRKDKKFTNFELPELQHNLNLLVEMCEEAIVSNDRKLQYAENRCVALEAEVETLTKQEKEEANMIEVLDKVMAVVQRLVSGAEDNSITLQEASLAFRELQEKYYMEYCIYEVSSLADTVVRPLFKDYLSAWSPLQDPAQPVEIFRQWRSILEQDQTLTVSSTQDPYHKLLWDTWIPCVRIAVSAWQPRKFEPMVEFVETWKPLVPSWTMDNVLQQLILPRLHQEVEEWNPLTDTIPIHTWIHPWLPLLGKYLNTTIFPMIRHKLAAALVSWHPSDCSARLMLRPWVGAFSKGEMDAFLINNIVPKLHLTLQEFVINPHQQHLDNWNWVMEWQELLPSHVLASLLDKSFFPKWLQVLTLWLNLNPNYDQVTNWYTGWKSVLPEPLLNEPVIKEHLRSALELMNRSVGGGSAPQPSQQEAAQAQARYQGLVECIKTTQQVPQQFKDLVQKRCEELGIVWMPLPNRYREAKQVYKCGKLQVYIDRNVLFVCNSGQWEPTSLNALLEMAI